jgi:hypothetical protein
VSAQRTTIVNVRDLQLHSSEFWRILKQSEKRHGLSLTEKARNLMTEIEADGPNQYRLVDFDTGRSIRIGVEGNPDGSSAPEFHCSCGYRNYSNKPCSHLVSVEMARAFLSEVHMKFLLVEDN